MERRIISFELRVGVDDDIYNALTQTIDKENSRSSIIRAALRYYLLKQPLQRNHMLQIEESGILLEKTVLGDDQLDCALDSLLNF